jgi:rare lipoprotein A
VIGNVPEMCHRSRLLLIIAVAIILGACSAVDAPPVNIESTPVKDGAPILKKDVDKILDAVPQPVTRTKAGNTSPYTVFDQTYTLLPESTGYQEQGYASWYGTKFHGRYTANGEIYDMWGMTAAHKTLPIPSYVRVVNLHNQRSVIVRVNDRGPFHSDRIIDLSYAAATKLGFASQGVAFVEVTDVTPLARDDSSAQVQTLPTKPPSVVKLLPSKTPAATAASVSSQPVAKPNSDSALKTAVPADKKRVGSAVNTPVKPVTLQVGAFRQQASANKLTQKLSSILPVPVQVVSSEGAPQWHRVHVGPVSDQQTLDKTRELLAEQGIKKPQIVK